MCGRFAFTISPSDLRRLFGVDNLINFPARYNAAPMQEHAVIVHNRMGLARWGLLPPWAQGDDKALAAKMTNARSETVAEKPAFREAWEKGRRCLIPADGFYEWHRVSEKGPNQPYFVHRSGRRPIAMAGLWAKMGELVTFTILTKAAVEPIDQIHHRMPVMFDAGQAAAWFSAAPGKALAMMRDETVADIVLYPVGFEVGKVANDSAGLMGRVEAVTAATLF